MKTHEQGTTCTSPLVFREFVRLYFHPRFTRVNRKVDRELTQHTERSALAHHGTEDACYGRSSPKENEASHLRNSPEPYCSKSYCDESTTR